MNPHIPKQMLLDMQQFILKKWIDMDPPIFSSIELDDETPNLISLKLIEKYSGETFQIDLYKIFQEKCDSLSMENSQSKLFTQLVFRTQNAIQEELYKREIMQRPPTDINTERLW